jgi:hypothetical protein
LKSTCFLLPTIVLAVLLHGMAHARCSGQIPEMASSDGAATTAFNHGGAAAQSSPADSANGRDSDGQRDHRRAVGKDLARSHAILTKTRRLTTVPRNRGRSGSATAFHFRQPAQSTSSGGEGRGLLRDNTLKNSAPVRSPHIVRPARTAVSHARHRSPNPAIISGSVNSKTRPAAEISGTLMDRRR